MNTLLLRPTDVLFFRDGRPMEGSLAGHGAAWPLPNVTDAAFHAALHRSGLAGHGHDHIQGGNRTNTDKRKYGSLVTGGPFPVRQLDGKCRWYFPRPLDLIDDSIKPGLAPTIAFDPALSSSLPDPLEYAVANRLAPSKESSAPAWIPAEVYSRYLNATNIDGKKACGFRDDQIFDAEATIGIAIDPETGTTGQGDAAGKIYSARYLRLRDEWRLGVFAQTQEKSNDRGAAQGRFDLIPKLIGEKHHLLVGGQQRLCTAERLNGDTLPLPLGKSRDFPNSKSGNGKWRVKWVLLSPAIWPAIGEMSQSGRRMVPHNGGYLPNWVREEDGQVMLRSGKSLARRYSGKATRGFEGEGETIGAKLVAALVPKPLVITGWALADGIERQDGGAKSAHLAVPAGAIYYFEANTKEDAEKLAAVLNWHGDQTQPTTIVHRRSTLMGEKGFGLGVCGGWDFFPETADIPGHTSH